LKVCYDSYRGQIDSFSASQIENWKIHGWQQRVPRMYHRISNRELKALNCSSLSYFIHIAASQIENWKVISAANLIHSLICSASQIENWKQEWIGKEVCGISYDCISNRELKVQL